MKRLSVVAFAALASVGTAGAADLPAPAPAPAPPVYRPPVVVVSTWTGCYLGGHTGVAWTHKQYFTPTTGVDQGSHSPSGFAAGLQGGCDYQAGLWVVGIQGMIDVTDMKSDHLLPPTSVLREDTHVRWFGTLTGRLGYSVLPQGLLYLKGGVAWVHDDHNEYVVATNAITGSANVTRLGWTAGVGWEFMFAPSWSAFVEYNYLGFDTRTIGFTAVSGPGPFQFDIRQNVQSAIVGVNYRFGAGAPLARY